MTTNPGMISTPTLVLTIGSGLVPAAADVQRIFLQSDARRRVITRFLALDFSPKQPVLKELEVTERRKRSETISRSQAIEMAKENESGIQNGVRSVLHDLRSHEKLLDVGLGGMPHLPLDVVVLADLVEPEAAALSFLLPLIHSLLAEEPYARVHLLLSIASFSEKAEECAHARESLQSISEILVEGRGVRLPQVYLFDRYKEGVWEAHDMGELQTIIGNFILALLSGGLAQQLAHQMTQLDVVEHQAYFCSASATALIFDVAQLQRACALRLGAEILGMEFHSSQIPDPAPVEEMVADFSRSYATPRTWTARLCRESLFRPQGETDVELHFSDLRFEDVPMQDWAKTILAYDTGFKDRTLPAQIDLVSGNANGLKDEFLDQTSRLVQTLPQQPQLYPGGVTAARIVIARLQKNFQAVRFVSEDVSSLENECNEQINLSLERLEKAMHALPKPPVWVFRLPRLLRRLAVEIFNLLFLYRDLNMLTDLRQAGIRLVEQKYERLMKEVIHQKLNDLSAGWSEAFGRHAKSLKRLQSALDKLHLEFNMQSMKMIAPESLFRLTALDESVLAWAYYQGNRPREGFRRSLLDEHGFLSGWQKVNSRILWERLETFCNDVYQPLSGTDLEEALRHREGRDAGFLALAMMQGAVPLLRPNFDQTGGGASFQLRFLQSKDPFSSSLLAAFKSDEQEWEYLRTDDRLIATCCRVRMMIPATALAHVFERGKIKDM